MERMQPKVTIVIPVYNGSNYMREAIDSALNQTYQNIEVIVVNDGSKDNTEGIALSYGDKIRYYAKENGGVASALNLGIKVMEGEYFSWLSHDDIYLEDKIEKQISYLQREGDPRKIIFGSWLQKNMQTKQNQEIPPEYRFSIERIQTGVFPVLFGLINGCTLLIHKSHFERVGLFNEKLLTSQDYDFWFRLMRDQTMIYMQEPTVIQRIHQEQGSKIIREFINNCEDLQIRMIEELSDKEIESIFGGKLKLYYDMFIFSEQNNWMKCKEFFEAKIMEQIKCEPLFKMQKKKGQRLIIFCAGRNGCKIKKELYIKNIDIDYFCDNNSALWGTLIDGTICIQPSQLNADDIILVTKDNPEDLIAELQNKGFIYVIGYNQIAKDLFNSPVDKKRILDFYNLV